MSHPRIHATIFSHVKGRRLLATLLLAVMCFLSLSACGKRPAQVDPPPGVSKSVYTRQYPDIETDGRP
jgi:hypothetical protein